MTTLLPDTPEYSAAEVAQIIEAGHPLQIMDVRAPERLAMGRIDIGPEGRFHNMRGSVLIKTVSPVETGLDKNTPVVVVCGHGKDSKIITAHLRRMGFDARSLAGGVVSWFDFSLPRALDPPEGVDRLLQFDRLGKGCLAYLIVSDGQALIIDPPLNSEEILRSLEESEAELVGVADTHVHADYVSGAVEISSRFGVPYHLHPADAVYPYDGSPGKITFQPLAHGDHIGLGEASLEVVHTPGHTEGSVSFLLEGRAAFTGDFLLIESLGRPDLGEKAEEWARVLWGSVESMRGSWDPGLAIYPAHYTSEAGRRRDGSVGADLGSLLGSQPLLALGEEEEFVRSILALRAPIPEAYRKIKALNLGLSPINRGEVLDLEVGRNECGLG